jgi:hypothetical protein
LPLTEVAQFLHDENQAIALNGVILESAGKVIKCLKLNLPKEYIISDVMDRVVMDLPCPFEIRIQMRVPPKAFITGMFQFNVKRESKGGLFASPKRFFSNKKALENQETEGVTYVAFEWVFVLIRNNADQLREDLSRAEDVLNQIGEFHNSAVEQYHFYASSLLGSEFQSGSKFDFGGTLESHKLVSCLLPIALRGTGTNALEFNNSSLGLHRLNHTVDVIDIYSKANESFSAVIVGDTGYGKSVFLSQLIKSMHHDEKAKIIIIDVKGSHKRVVGNLGGEILDVNLTNPSGINPFEILLSDRSEDSLNLLKTFLAQLCLEENESFLPETFGSVLGITLVKYAGEFKTPSLKEFVKFIPKDFARLPHLKRYTEGIEAKIFEKTNRDRNARLTYYYIAKLETAENKSLRKAMVSSVLIDFYMNLRTKPVEDKVMLVCDEAPFFIADAFPIFSMLIKNIRAQHGSLVLSVQKSQDLLGFKNNWSDASLMEQPAVKILFNADGNREEFKTHFSISDIDLLNIENFSTVKGAYSQMLVKDRTGSRIMRLYITDPEYWDSVTGAVEMAEIEDLKKKFPELNDREVALILTEARARHQIQKKQLALKKYNEEDEKKPKEFRFYSEDLESFKSSKMSEAKSNSIQNLEIPKVVKS